MVPTSERPATVRRDDPPQPTRGDESGRSSPPVGAARLMPHRPIPAETTPVVNLPWPDERGTGMTGNPFERPVNGRLEHHRLGDLTVLDEIQRVPKDSRIKT